MTKRPSQGGVSVGSARVSDPLSLVAGQQIRFDWKFEFADDPEYSDIGFVELLRLDPELDVVRQIKLLAACASSDRVEEAVNIAVDGLHALRLGAGGACAMPAGGTGVFRRQGVVALLGAVMARSA